MTVTTTRAAETWAHLTRCQREGVPAFPWALDFAQDGGDDLDRACAAVEAVAQQHLDAHPDDHGARRALGEWLRECGDERGPGYVALGVCKRRPYKHAEDAWTWFRSETADPDDLRPYWYELLDTSEATAMSRAEPPMWADWPARRVAEDAAARAFLRLAPERREQLLMGSMSCVDDQWQYEILGEIVAKIEDKTRPVPIQEPPA